MDFCGIQIPQKVDGRSLKPLLSKASKNEKNVAYSYFNKGITMRNDRYRLTQYYIKEQPTIELYDLKKDPFETTNIAQLKTNIVKKLMPFLEKGNTGLYQK